MLSDSAGFFMAFASFFSSFLSFFFVGGEEPCSSVSLRFEYLEMVSLDLGRDWPFAGLHVERYRFFSITIPPSAIRDGHFLDLQDFASFVN